LPNELYVSNEMKLERKEEGKRRREFFRRGEFDRALASIDQSIEQDPDDSLLYRERAHIYLYLGRTQKARADFDMTQQLQEKVFRTKPGRLQSDGEITAIGLTYWMEGHRDLALSFWRYATASLVANRVSYAHMGGGIDTGLVLWFGAAYERNEDDIALVKQFYEKRLASTHWSHSLKCWPGPIVRFFLGQIDADELIDSAEQSKQKLGAAHFAIAVRSKETRRYAMCKKHLKEATGGNGEVDMYDYYNQLPFFIARFEVGA
jgi:tetratricopeptide (TPR) repeat protein